MQLKTILSWGILACLLTNNVVQAAANISDQSLSEYRYVTFDDIAKPKKEDLTTEQEKLLKSYVLKKYDKYFKYENYGAYTVNDRFVYVKLYLMLKDEFISEWRDLQRQRAMSGEKRLPSLTYDLAVIDKEKNTAFPLDVPYKTEDGVLRFHFSGCLNNQFAFESDINLDGKKELFFIRGYQSGFDVYNTVFHQYKLYLLADFDNLLFDEWLTNIDHGYVDPVSYKKPNITGLGGGTPYPYLVKYDEYGNLVKPDGLGLKRYNSQFFFDYIDKDDKGISKQLVLIWSRIYRPSPDSKNRDFILDEERFKWYEGDVLEKTAFVEKSVTEEAFKAFLAEYSLSFEDGLTEKRLCGVK